MVGDFNINAFDSDESKKVQRFLNLMFRHNLIPTRVTRNAGSAIDRIITKSVINTEFKTGITKTDISNHFPIFFTFECVVDSAAAREDFINERNHSAN